jgi:hypothetical protein
LLDAITNVDRTFRNTICWSAQELWLIDHGASLYFHHSWTNWKSTHKVLCTDKRSCIIASSFLLPETDVLFKKYWHKRFCKIL